MRSCSTLLLTERVEQVTWPVRISTDDQGMQRLKNVVFATGGKKGCRRLVPGSRLHVPLEVWPRIGKVITS